MYKVNKKNALKIWKKISENKKITLATHIDPDGDTIAGALAFKEIIKLYFKDTEIKISGDKYPRYLNFLENNEEVEDNFFKESLKIVIDTSTPNRIWDKRVITSESIKIDHHHKEAKWMLEIGGDYWPSVGQTIYEFCKVLDLKIDQKIKDLLFICLWTDTDGMKERNIGQITRNMYQEINKNKETLLKNMKLNKAEKKHIEKLKLKIKNNGQVSWLVNEEVVPNDYIRQAVGIWNEFANSEVFISVTKDENGFLRGEIRGKGKIDVSIFAKKFGGGGHFSSSGFKPSSIDKAYKNINFIIKEVN